MCKQSWVWGKWRGAVVLVAASWGVGCGPSAEVGPPPLLIADPPPTDDGRSPGAGASDFDRGVAYVEKEAWEQAVPHFDKSLEADPNNAEAHYYRALAQARLGNDADAEKGLERAIELKGDLVLARAHLGELYLVSEPPRAKKAIEVLKPAAQADPKDADTQQLLAYAYRLEKRYNESAKHYEATLKIENNPKFRFDYADMLFEAGRLDQAVAQMRLALPAFADDVAVVAQLAHRFAKAKAYDDCIEAFSRAIELNAKEPGFHLHRGLCKHSRQDEEGARADYQKAVGIDPKFQAGWYYLGMSFLEGRRTTQAVDALEKASKIDKNSAVGKKAKEKLDELGKGR
jgi:tetratricopeptide (TPR) repeat protein